MPTNVLMPQMGESIAEGTIVRWIKKVGEKVDRDEPLFEISTDKVDAEIPSPAAGVVAEIRAKEGETIAVNAVVAVIGEAGSAAAQPPATGASAAPPPPSQPAAAAPPAPPQSAPAPPPSISAEPSPPRAAEPGRPAPAAASSAAPAGSGPSSEPPTAQPPSSSPQPGSPVPSRDELRRQKSSPLVRRIAAEHGVEIQQIPGTGIGGRVTKHDILDFLDRGEAAPAAPPQPSPTGQQPLAGASTATAPGRPPGVEPGIPPAWGVKPREHDEVVPMTTMRKRIAEHMIASRRTSAHVHSVFEVDFSRVAKIRDALKADYERAGAKLTYLPFIVKAVVDGLREVPVVNASVEGETVVYHKAINVGIAVALDWGLIVPVVKRADELNILGLSRAMADLANRARTKQLKPEEVQGGTFTITNPGVFGALFGMPIISQPQVAILGVGAVEKRVVVVGDAIAVRPMAYLSLGYDHRVIDGAVADAFMSIVKKQIETFDAAAL